LTDALEDTVSVIRSDSSHPTFDNGHYVKLAGAGLTVRL
jgi:hypothetical protein